MNVIYHIKALHRQGLTTREIAAALKINRESVLKYIKQPVIIRSPIKREWKTAINPYLPYICQANDKLTYLLMFVFLRFFGSQRGVQRADGRELP